VGVTTIEWCDYTFNPWIGCAKVSPGCKNCYASVGTFTRFQRSKGLELWGEGAARHVTSQANWRKPLAWAAAARKSGTRPRVFCASMSDVFENRRDLDDQRARLWKLIEATPELDWLLLTKRPENFRLLPMVDGGWKNIRLGVTAEDQPRADERIDKLVRIQDVAGRFVSYEPALGPVDFRRWLEIDRLAGGGDWVRSGFAPEIDQIIVGGESGPGARPFDLAWARSVREQCHVAGVTFFFKQAGSRPWDSGVAERALGHRCFNEQIVADFSLKLRDRKGGDLAEIPGMWPREFPR
jgi:protein gp37